MDNSANILSLPGGPYFFILAIFQNKWRQKVANHRGSIFLTVEGHDFSFIAGKGTFLCKILWNVHKISDPEASALSCKTKWAQLEYTSRGF